MSAPVYTLYCVELGVTQTLKAWGINATNRKLRSMQPSELQLTFSQRSFVNAPPLQKGYHCTVYQDGVAWFVGKVYDPDRSAQPQAHRHIVTLRCPWAVLEAIIYKQTTGYVTAPTLVPNLGSYETLTDAQIAANAAWRSDFSHYLVTQRLSPHIFTGTDETTGGGAPSDTTVAQCLAYAATRSPNLFQIGTSFSGILTPREEMRDVSIAEVIRRVVRWTPDVVQDWDFSTSPPTLHFHTRAGMASRDLAWADNSVIPVAGAEIKPRYDIQRKGIRFYMERGNQTGDLAYNSLELLDEAGDLTDPESLLEATVQLDPITTDLQTGDISAHDATPVGMAARMLTALSQLFYNGKIDLAFQDLPYERWLSKVINISNADGELAAMRAVVQESSENIERGRVTLTLGAPARLSSNDLQALAKLARSRIPGTQNGSNGNINGGGGHLNIQPPVSPPTNPGTVTDTSDMTPDESPGTGLLSDFQKSVAGDNSIFHLPQIYPAFGPVPGPLVPVGSGTVMESALQQISNQGIGWTNEGYVISATLDLTSFSPANYKAAQIVLTVHSNMGITGSFTRYMSVTNGLGRRSRLVIPLASVPTDILLGPGVVGGNNQNAVFNIITAANVQVQRQPAPPLH